MHAAAETVTPFRGPPSSFDSSIVGSAHPYDPNLYPGIPDGLLVCDPEASLWTPRLACRRLDATPSEILWHCGLRGWDLSDPSCGFCSLGQLARARHSVLESGVAWRPPRTCPRRVLLSRLPPSNSRAYYRSACCDGCLCAAVCRTSQTTDNIAMGFAYCHRDGLWLDACELRIHDSGDPDARHIQFDPIPLRDIEGLIVTIRGQCPAASLLLTSGGQLLQGPVIERGTCSANIRKWHGSRIGSVRQPAGIATVLVEWRRDPDGPSLRWLSTDPTTCPHSSTLVVANRNTPRAHEGS